MAYTADINIVVKGQAAVNALQKSLTSVGEKIDELAKKRIGPSTTLDTFNKQLAEASKRLTQVAAGTSRETDAIKNYVTALGNANAATERQNKLIQNEIALRQAATKGAQELATVQQHLFEKQRQLENSKLDAKAAQIQRELDKQAAAAQESAAQLEKLNARQQEFITRTDAAAQAAARQTAEFIRQQRIAKEVTKLNANAPAPQLLLAPAAPGSPAMSGGARRQITGPVERLGGARTEDQAAMALRFAQALKEQVRPLSQIQSLYAGIAQQAAQMQRIKALPDSAMLNAAGRGIQSLEVAQDRYNRELQESAQRLQQLDRLEQARERRARKLQDIADYYGSPSAMENAGFGVQGPAVPPDGVKRKPKAPGGRTAGQVFENLALGAGFPLLFGGGPGQVLGGLAGSFVGTGFGGQILGSAIGGQLEQLGIAANQAGQALQKPIDNFAIIEQRALLASSSQERYVKNLIDAGQYIEATAAVQKRYNEIIGEQGSRDLLQLTQSSDELSRTWAEVNVQLQAAIAGPLAGLLKWINDVLRVNVTEPGKETANLQQFMKQLSPEQRSEYFRRSIELRDRNKGVVDPAALRRLQQEMLPGFGAKPAAQEAAKQGFQATEVKEQASLERRREIQAQITQLRQAELAAAQAQLQQDTALLTKQQEFTTSLNQESAIIDKLAAKKVESATLEYRQVYQTQQAEVTNKQLALEAAQSQAKVTEEKFKQLQASRPLTEAEQEQLQAAREDVLVKERALKTANSLLHVTTQRAQKEYESKNTIIELERRQQNVAAFAADAARQTEAFNRAANETTNALNNRVKVSDALTQAALTVNNIEIQSLQNKLAQATTDGDRLKILDKIRDLEIANAALTLQATRTQIQAEVERQRIAMSMAEVKYKELQAVVQLAAAQKVLTQSHLEALRAQASALQIARDNYATSVKVADAQMQAANAVYNASVNAANLRVQMEGTAAAAGAVAGAMDRVAAASGGGGGGRGFSLGFGEAGNNPYFMKQFNDAIQKLNQQYAGKSTMFFAEQAYNATLAEFRRRAQEFNQRKAKETLASAEQEFYAGTTRRQNAMASYSPATAIEDLRASATKPQVNITTGPVMQMDGTNYVTQRDLVSATGTAARQGAKMALEMLQNNPSSRRSTGVTR